MSGSQFLFSPTQAPSKKGLPTLAPYTFFFTGFGSLYIFLLALPTYTFFSLPLAPNTFFYCSGSLYILFFWFWLPIHFVYRLWLHIHFFTSSCSLYIFFTGSDSLQFFYWLQLPLKRPGSPTLNITYRILQINNELDYI